MMQTYEPPNGVVPQYQLPLTVKQQPTLFHQQQQPMPVYQPQVPINQQQQPTPVIQQPVGLPVNQPQPYFVSVAVVAPPQVQGRFAPHLSSRSTKVCGDLLITLGVFMMVGQMLETIGFSGLSYRILLVNTYIAYVGYWGGVIVCFNTYCYYYDHCRRHRHRHHCLQAYLCSV
jgi:hypothetical protein